MKKYIKLFAVIILTFCYSCDSSEPECSQWDPDWDEKYERHIVLATEDYRKTLPTDVIWHGKRLEVNNKRLEFNDEIVAMLKAEAAKPSVYPLRVTTDSYGQLKKKIGSKALDIDELIVTGPVNSDDLTYIKRCVAMGNLRSVDLSAAQIQDNTIPQEAFFLYEYPENSTLHGAYLPLFRIKLPKGMKIGAFAFANSLLTEIEMPEVAAIGQRCFCDAFMLGGEINITKNTKITDSESFMRAGNGDLVVNFDNKILPRETFHNARLKELNLAEGLEEIEANAINGVFKLDKLELPSTLKKLGESSLKSNYRIKTLTLPASLESIEKYALANLSGLETLHVKFTDPYIAEGARNLDEAGEYYRPYYDEWFTPFGNFLTPSSEIPYITPPSVKVYVPQSALSEFKKSFVWGEWFWGNIFAE